MSTSASGQKIALLNEVMRAIGGASAVPAPIQPVGAKVDFAALSREAALSAERIACAVANLALDRAASESSKILWTETLRQIARVQRLHGLPPLPFQTGKSVSASASET